MQKTTSHEAHCHLLQLKKNNEGGGRAKILACRHLLQLNSFFRRQLAERLVVVFYNWTKTTKDDNKLRSRLVIIFCTWGKRLRHNDKRPNLSLFSTTDEKNAKNDNDNELKDSLLFSCNWGIKPRDDKEPLSSLLFSNQEQWQARILAHCCLLQLRKINYETTMSREAHCYLMWLKRNN
jgi:hypothetical protein